VLASFSKFNLAITCLVLISACASAKYSGSGIAQSENGNIENPFGSFAQSPVDPSKNITFRSKRGDKQMEVEIPQDQSAEFQVPMNPQLANAQSDRSPAQSSEGVDYQYVRQKATVADREIASTFTNHDDPIANAKRREIESGLGLQPSDELPNMDESYLAKVDVVKQLFHSGRHEAALIEIDALIKQYPTNGKLYEMRGTVLDRLGYSDLALKSWKQALEFEPSKMALKKIIDRREMKR
jgi:tetratricopeptide (TPR) repeat protein